MKKASVSPVDQDIPERKREQLGAGVRGKYLKHFGHHCTVPPTSPMPPASASTPAAPRPHP